MLKAAVQQGRRATLVALRDALAEAIDEKPEPRDLAALSLRLEKVVAELDGLPDEAGKGSVSDALAARRKAKQAASG